MDFAGVLPPTNSTVPAGAGVGSVTADTNGNARFTIALADGTKLVAAGAISKDGSFPLYQALYGGGGSIFSSLSFTNDGASRIAGVAAWNKPARPLDARYRGGFTKAIEARGSIYSRTEVTNALAAGAASVRFNFLPTPETTNVVTWNHVARLTNSAGLSLTLSPASGLWSGVYFEPTSRQRLPFQTTLQPAVGGFLGNGFLIQSNVSGLVTFTVAP
jgi:hypothetical protein